MRVNSLAAVGGVLMHLCVWPRKPLLLWADSSHHSNNEVHTTLPGQPPASVTYCHHPGGQAHLHTFTHIHRLAFTHWQDTKPAFSHMPTHTYTILLWRGEKKQIPEERKNKKNFTSFMDLSTCDWSVVIVGPERRLQSWHWYTHTSSPQSRILGLFCSGVECGSRGTDQHGEPGRETGRNRVRSGSCIVVYFNITDFFVCLSLSVYVKSKILHLNTIDMN